MSTALPSEGLQIKSVSPITDGFVVVDAIDSATGTEHLIVCDGEPQLGDHVHFHVPEHERTGRLPRYAQVAVDWYLVDRCAGTRKDGHPCQNTVPRAGDRCRWHR